MSGLYFGISVVDNSVVIGNLIDLAGSKFILSKDDIDKVFIGDDGTFRLPHLDIQLHNLRLTCEVLLKLYYAVI